MASLFDPVPTVAAQTNAAPGMNINARPEAFGADVARAESGFGEAVQHASAIGMDALIAKQKLTNEVHASEVNTWLADRITDRHTEFGKLEGKAALDGLPQYKADIDDLYQQSMQQGGSLSERAMLAKTGRYLTTRYYGYATAHANSQWRSWADQTATNRAATYGAQAGIAAQNGDDAGMEVALHTSDDEVAKLYEQRGWDREAIGNAVSKNRGRNLGQIIQARAVDGEDPVGAVEMFRKYSGQMDPISRLATANKLRPLVANLRGAEVADEILGREPAGQPQGGRSQTIMQKFQEAGYTPEQSAAAAGHLFHESANNPNSVHDGGIGIGIAGWNGERRAALEKFAAGKGKPVNDFDTQVDFAIQELDTTEGKAGAALKNAKSVEDATAAFMHFERPRGYTPDNPRGGDSYDARLANAIKFANGNFSAALPDKGRTIERIIAQTDGNPAVQRAAIARANLIYSTQQSNTAQAAAAFKGRWNDTAQEAWRTGTVQQPLTRMDFMENYGAAEGARNYGEYQAQLQLGADKVAVATMTPQERAELRTRYAPQPGAGYAESAKRADLLDKAIAAVAKEQADDPAGFASRSLPAVAQAQSRLIGALTDPKARDEERAMAARTYAETTLAEQERVGIAADARRVLPGHYVDALNRSFGAAASAEDPQARTGLVAQIRREAAMWGEHWPAVMQQLNPVSQPIVRAIAADANPEAMVRLLSVGKDESVVKLLKEQNETKYNDMTKKLNDVMGPFRRSLLGRQLDRDYGGYYGLAEKLTALYIRDDEDPGVAAEKAFKALIGDRYDFRDTWRMPKSAAVPADEVQRGVLEAQRQMRQNPGGAFDIQPAVNDIGVADNIADSMEKFARDGKWVTSYDNSGLNLVYNGTGGAKFVRRRDGSPVQFTWAQLAALGQGQTASTQEMRNLTVNP